MTEAAPAELPAQRFARALLSGEVGFALFDRLTAEFPAIGRPDVFFGCALALSELHAGLIAAELELRALRGQDRRAAA